MAINSIYCKAYHVLKYRSFPGWDEDTSNLRKARNVVDGKEVEVPRSTLTEDDVLYLHDNFVVTDGIFQDENIVFQNATPEWKRFCAEQLQFAIPDYVQQARP